jgi:2-polyprenyl-3-methyl-5-hydroxy-6-metoxy-1,4-benzoquinol methylase|tara:strand:+ start:171 stop:1139 length:969 start_codon:yes stop_codon:yes gene_type:complete
MKKIFRFSSNTDVSSKHINFNILRNYSIRNKIRDKYDQLIRRPIYDIVYKNFFKFQDYQINHVLPAKGFSTLERRNKLNKIKKIKNKNILNIGCGNAFDYHMWFKFKPNKIVGIDVLNYKTSWNKVSSYVKKENIKTKIEFYNKDFDHFNYKEKFDFIVSDAVYEHCKNFSSVIRKCSKLLKKNGILYASYGGPLWYTYGGDHFSGRDEILNGYNHLLLNKKEYKNYFKKNVRSLEYELNEGGGGGILVQEDLFSKLSGNEYMKIFNQNNFISKKTYVEFCPIGYKLIRKNKKLREKLLKKYPNMKIENYYLKTHIVYLKKR